METPASLATSRIVTMSLHRGEQAGRKRLRVGCRLYPFVCASCPITVVSARSGHSGISTSGGRVERHGVLLVGLCTVDVVQRVTELPGPGEKIQSRHGRGGGGRARRQRRGRRRRAGRPVTAGDGTGHTSAGHAGPGRPGGHGVRVRDVRPDRLAPPAVSAISVRERDGERVVVSHNAAGCPGRTAAGLGRAAGRRVGALLVDGHHPELAVAAARAARGRRVPVVLDAGSDKPVLPNAAAAGRRVRVLGGLPLRQVGRAGDRAGGARPGRAGGAADRRRPAGALVGGTARTGEVATAGGDRAGHAGRGRRVARRAGPRRRRTGPGARRRRPARPGEPGPTGRGRTGGTVGARAWLPV